MSYLLVEANPVARFLRRYEVLERAILGSGISRSPDRYIIFTSWTVLGLIAYSFLFTLFLFSRIVPLWLSLLIAIYITGFIVTPLSLALAIGIPLLVYKNRGSKIETKFMILALYLTSLLAGGMTISEAFRELATTHKEELVYFDVELRLINYRLRIGEPVDKVLDDVARITPSPSLRELFQSLAAASRVGSATLDIVNTAVAGYLERFNIRLDKEVNSLNITLDSYVTVAMTTPIIIGAMALLYAMSGEFGQYMQIVMLTTFVLLPLFSIVTLIMADSIASRMRL
ncbi:type II secretion system F family protein [Desulfurococcaceae archaeon MEX13E-LK6-19]|nr:type II secretion system F family protein [Desulfurococcaceae archaeon MEX13E-LK6-19]